MSGVERDIQAELDELTTLIGQEEKMWEISQIAPPMINVDTYLLAIKMRAVLSLLENELNMTTSEVEVYFKQAVLDQLKQDRKMVIKARAQQMPQNGHGPDNPFGGIILPGQ